jgi:hypothetical protein
MRRCTPSKAFSISEHNFAYDITLFLKLAWYLIEEVEFRATYEYLNVCMKSISFVRGFRMSLIEIVAFAISPSTT